MINTITDRFTEKQALIDLKRKALCQRYPSLWLQMVADWSSDASEDAAWLTYSANYLLRCSGVRFAIDPLALHWRVPEAPEVDVFQDLQQLSFVLLTHDHRDHLDLALVRALSGHPIRWVIPQFLVEKVLTETDLSEEKVIVPKVMKPFEIEGLSILPFEGQHLITYSDGTCKGVLEMSYLIESAGRRWLFPGDTRVYDLSRFPKFGPVDLSFMHLWLGHKKALTEGNGLLQDFCSFAAGLQPRRMAITHLEEFGRDADDFIDDEHVNLVNQVIAEKYPSIAGFSVHTGEKVLL
jgi:L-ascorbate metabolism protein UlaG (beta-lactamase superfamily)